MEGDRGERLELLRKDSSVLKCVAGCCRVLQSDGSLEGGRRERLELLCQDSSVLQCAAVYCRAMAQWRATGESA